MNEAGITLLISLITAHLAGDFVLQTSKDVATKKQPFVFVKHILIVTGLSYVLSGLWTEWRIPLVIFITHSIIDWLKIISISSGSDKKQLSVFLIDQFSHIVIIVLLSMYLQNRVEMIGFFWSQYFLAFNRTMIFVSAIVLLTKPGGIVIGYLVNPFLKQIINTNEAEKTQERLRGLANGGRIIGYLERILILIFIFSGNFSAVGFLIAAKSVFRFGELTNPNNRMEAEYIIIGTLYSFIYSLLISYGIIYILNII